VPVAQLPVRGAPTPAIGVDSRADLAKLRGVADERQGWPWHLRQGKKLSKGKVVVTEHDASGQLVRSTFYYSSDEGLLTKIIGAVADEGRSPTAG
jgi:hypothetical protein